MNKRRVKKAKVQSMLEQRFVELWHELAPDLQLEPQFKDTRIRGIKRCLPYDFKVINAPILIEINGGTAGWYKSGHTTAAGIRRDYIKINRAQMLGYFIFVLSTTMVSPLHIREIVQFTRNLCYANTNPRSYVHGQTAQQ